MELLLSDEQKLLHDSAATLIERHAGAGRMRAQRDSPSAIDREAWAAVAEAGWLAILAPDEAGGLGLGLTELALIAEQAGKGLLDAPVAAAALAARTIAEGDSETLRADVVPEIVAGERIVVPALQETVMAPDAEPGAVAATKDGGGFRLTGTKRFVPCAAGADGFVINAAGADGTVVCYVPSDAVEIATTKTVDGGGWGDVSLAGATVPAENVIAGPNRAPAFAIDLIDSMLIALGAELLGVAGAALDMAVEYIKVREQFDRPIGSFQALQHRAVNDYIEVETTRSLVFQAAEVADAGRGTSAMASAVKAKASSAALIVAKSAIQMHGGIGFTDEHDIGLYLKRAMALSAQYGNETTHRARYARLAGIEAAG